MTASLTSGVLDVRLSAANDQAVITPSGSNIVVSGTNLSAETFSAVTTLVVQGTNTSSQDVPDQVVTFEGSGTIALHSAPGTSALIVSGVTSVGFTGLTIDATSGNVDVEAAETTSATGVQAASAPQASVTVLGASIQADNITLDASASSSYVYGAALGGTLNSLGAATAVADLEPSATVSVVGASTKITVNGAGGNVAIGANVSVTVNSDATVGTDVDGNALNPADAAIAESVVNSSAIANVGGGSTVSAGSGTGTLSVTSANTTTVTTEVDGSGALGGASGAVTLDNSTSQASVSDGSTLTGSTVDVSATTTNTANTTADATATGAGPNSAIQDVLGGKVDPAYLADATPSDPNPAYKTSPAETALSAGVPLSVAGAVAVTKFTPTTQAYVDSSTVTASNAINISASSDNNATTVANASTVTANADNSVGVAVAINDTDANNTATVESTTGTAKLSAPTIGIAATTPTASSTDVHNDSASATSGASGADVGVAGALALNIVSNTSAASVPSGSTVVTAGNVAFNSQNSVTETATAQPVLGFAEGSGGGALGAGASVALNIDSNTTLAELQDAAQLTGANNLTFSANSSDMVNTNAVSGSSGGALSLSPSVGISVVTNTTAAQIGVPDTANDPLVIGGALSATATHIGLATTTTGGASTDGDLVSAGVSVALGFVTDQTTATTGRSLDAKGGGITFEADGTAASLISSSASASGGPTDSEESKESNTGPADGSEAAPGSDTADPNSVDGQNAQERDYADSESGTLTDSKGNPVSEGNTKDDAETPAAKTSDGSITVAAAVAVNIVDSQADATIPSGLTITASGPLTVTATNDTGNSAHNPIFGELVGSPGDTADAWGTAAGTSKVGVGAAVALNLVNASTAATIGASTINADGVTLNAGMMDPDPMNAFGATATSGAGAGDIGVAGAVAINIVNNSSQALIETGAAVNANGGDVSVNSLNNSTDLTFAVPAGAATGDSIGVGASLALNIISASTESEIQNGAALMNADNVSVIANSAQSIITWGQNGASGAVALGAGIAIVTASDQTTASIGSDPQTLNASGNVTIEANGSFSVNTLANAFVNTPGAASPAVVGLGASVVVNVTQDSFLAELDRNVTAGGAVSVTDGATSSSQASAIASEQGAPITDPDTGGSDGTADQETANQFNFADSEGGSDSPDVAAPPTSNSELSSPSSSAKSKAGSDGETSVGIAAAVAVNVQTSSTVAEIGNDLTVTAGGALTVGTTDQDTGLSLADGRATTNQTSIGAAVSLNVASVTNTATIGTSDTISAEGVSVTALMTPPVNNVPQVNDFSTQGLGVAIGSQVGVAGSVGINVISINTQASIGYGTVVSSFGGLNVQAANDQTLQNIAFTLAVGGDAGAGAAVDVNVLNNSTNAFLDSNVKANVADMTQVTAESSLNPSQDPVPNSPSDTIVATGTLTQGSDKVTGINGTVINILGESANTPYDLEPVTGPGVPPGTVILKTDNTPFTGNLVFGSPVIESDDLVLFDPLKKPETGDTVSGPGIVPGTTIVSLDPSLSGGYTITLSAPVFATGAAPLTYSDLELSQDATASGTVSLTETPVAGLTTALSSLHPTNFAAGAGASSGGAGVAGSFIVNVINQTTHAYVNSGATINTLVGKSGYPTANSDEGVTVSATETMSVVDWAGAIGGGADAGIGAALDVNIVNEDDQAYFGPDVTVDAAQDVAVEASTDATYQSITAAFGLGGSVAIAGAASIEVLSSTTDAYIADDTTVDAQGDVLVEANRESTIETTAGQLGVSGDASVGAAVSTIVDTVTTDAYIGAGDEITSDGTSGSIAVLTGNSPGDTTQFSGVVVDATTFQNLQSIAVGGAIGASVGAAGSAAVNVLNDTTLAYIGAGATVNATHGSPGTGPGVMVTAADLLTYFSTAGALAAGGDAGLGAGVDVDSITKNTQAYISTATVIADGDVLVEANSEESITSITAAVGASGSVAVAGSAGVYVLAITTRAFIGEDPDDETTGSTNVQAGGSALVAATEATVLDLLSGNYSGSGNASFGAAATVPVINKTTEAFIGADALVTALGLGAPVDAKNGQFAISYQPYGTAPGVVQPDPTSADLTGNGDSLTSPRLGEERVATPETQAINGLAVTAVNSDSIQGVGVTGGASGLAAVNTSGSVAVLSNLTEAYIGSGAAINSHNGNASAASSQSVLVAAANDASFLGVAGAESISGGVTVAPGVIVLNVTNVALAGIQDGASVVANGNVAVVAHSSGDVLTIAAAAAVSGVAAGGGSVSYVGVNDTTVAFIGVDATTNATGATVNAGGNVLVDATDATEAYLITGAVAVGATGAGIGGSVSIVNLNKNTDASIGDHAIVNALGNSAGLSGIIDGNYTSSGGFETLASFHGVAVQSSTSENVTNVAAAGAAGFFAGLAGGVSVELFNSTTKAFIGNNAQINADSSGASSSQSVNVAAVNQATNFSFAGGLGGGIAGIAGAVDVGLMENSTVAYIGAGAAVYAQQDVDVYALSNDTVQTYALGAAAGVVGAVGSVSVWSIGVPYNAGYTDGNASDGTVQAVSISGITNSSSSAEGNVSGASSMIGSLSDSNVNGATGNTQFISGTVSSSQASINGSFNSDPVAVAIENASAPTGTVAYIGSGVTVDAEGNVNVVAKSEVTYTGVVGGLAAGAVGIGGSVEIANIHGGTDAYIDTSSTVSAGGNVTVNAQLVSDTANGKVFAGTAGIVGVGAQVVDIQDSSTESASLNSGVTIPQADQVDVTASANRSLTAQALGGDIGSVAVGVGVAIANATGGASASIDSAAQIGQIGNGGVDIAATSADKVQATSYGVAAGYYGLTAVFASATSSPTVQASVGDDAAITSTGSVDVTAQDTPYANAETFGAAIAASVGVGAAVSTATVSGSTSSYLGDDVGISASSLSVYADRSRDSNNDPTAQSSAIAGVGGVLAGVNATDSQATSQGAVQATTGSSVALEAGSVSILANNQSDQNAAATGVAVGGVLAIGADMASATSGVTTLAELGAGAVTDVTGTLNISANGSDQNNASSTAGSGGLIAGDASVGSTEDSSTVSAIVGGGMLVAGTVGVSATNNSVFTPDVSSVNAALAGASGASATNSEKTSATATVSSSTDIMASFAVNITAYNTFTEDLPTSGDTVSAGAGGFLNGTAATSSTTITGNSDVTIGNSVSIDVQTPTTPSSGTPGIFMMASSLLDTSDQVTLSTGGVLEGAGTDSSLTATLNNNVSIQSTTADPDSFVTNENIGIGTYNTVSASNSSQAHTFGLGALASSSAETVVTSNQTVTLGPSTDLTALLNVTLTAGDNPTSGAGSAGSMAGGSNAQSYVRGFVAIPRADATTTLTSNATLNIGASDQIQSGENTVLAADQGGPIATATGIGHGYELGFIPVTDGTSTPTTTTTSNVTVNGTVTAGIYHELNITIPNAQDATANGLANFYSDTLIDNGATTTNVDSVPYPATGSPASAAFTAYFDPNFNPATTIDSYFAGAGSTQAQQTEAQMLVSDTSSTDVGAMELGPLFASGGDVTVDAGTLQGGGTITAYGGPTITVTNDSPDYLVLDSIDIPNEAGGQVIFTGTANSFPKVVSTGAGTRPGVNIQELYNQALPGSSNGPAVFATADRVQGVATLYPAYLENLGGQVSVTVADGAFISSATINAEQVNITTPRGIYAASTPTQPYHTGADPSTEWDAVMYWPDGVTSTSPINNAYASTFVAYVANALYNTDGQYGTLTGAAGISDSLNFTQNGLIGYVGEIPPDSFLNADEVPSTPDLGTRGSATSVVFLGDDLPYHYTEPSTDGTAGLAISESPLLEEIAISYDASQYNDGYFPVVPVEPLPTTTASYSQSNTSVVSSINAAGVFIDAETVDVDGAIDVGSSNNRSVLLSGSGPDSLNNVIAQDQTDYDNHIYSTTPGDAPGYYTLPGTTISAGDTLIPTQYDAITQQIVVSDVSAASGGFISLEGAIISTNTLGKINVSNELGSVTINNQINYPIVVNNVSASEASNSSSISGVEITDTNLNDQTLYVYQPGGKIDEYVSPGTTDSVQQLEANGPIESGQVGSFFTVYQPEEGLRWQWQLQADLVRTLSGVFAEGGSLSQWSFQTPTGATSPWYYLNSQNGTISDGQVQPTGWTTVNKTLENTDFQETITGSVQNWMAEIIDYHDNHYGFAAPAEGGDVDPWVYYFPTEVELTLTNSVKADNSIPISFSGPTQATVDITSDGPVILDGNIANPVGNTTITAPGLTQSSSATIATTNLTLNTNGVGTSSQPVNASLTAGGVLNVSSGGSVYLNLGSGALLGEVNSVSGDAVINAAGSLDPASGYSLSIHANNLTLNSATGEVGSAAAPLNIESGGYFGNNGVVNVSALLNIGLTQPGGTLQVGQILSTSGSVTISVPGGQVVNSDGLTWSALVSDAQSQQVWQSLGLTNPSAELQEAVTAFANEVNAEYATYWQLLDNGSVQNGVLTLNAAGLSLFSEQAGQAQSPATTSPTDAQIQNYANSLYQAVVAFFNANLGSNWMGLPDFQTYNPAFNYLPTAQQVSALEENAAWTTSQLTNSVARVALNPAAGNAVGLSTPNISGTNVTLTAGGNIGQLGQTIFIPLANLQSGNLTAAQSAALADATAPGDVLEVGTNAQGQTVTVPFGQGPAGFTLTGIQVSPTGQLFISASGTLTLSAGGSVIIQGTSEDLTLGKVAAGSTVNVTAPGSILSGGPGISTPGNMVLKVDSGTVGLPSAPLNVQQVGGTVSVYAPPGNTYLTGQATTLAISSIPATPTYGQSVTFTATISDSAGRVPTGTVQFYDGTTYLGQDSALSASGSNAISTFTTSTLTAGSHAAITAVYVPTGDFASSSNSLSLTVNPAPLTITALNESKAAGTTGTFGPGAFTESGLLTANGDTITGVIETSAGDAASAPAGTYAITPYDAMGTGLSNYTITYVDGTLTVTAGAPINVTGAADPVTATGATLHATVDPNGATTTAIFEYSIDPAFTPTVATTLVSSGLDHPGGVAVNAAGDVFVADSGDNAVKEILPGGTVETIGSGFNSPSAVAVDASGDVFVADTGNNVVKEILPDGTIDTIMTGLSDPEGVAVDAAGDVFVADTGNNRVVEMLPDSTVKTIGSGFTVPAGVAVDASGDVFVADTFNSAVKEVLPDGTIETIGSGFLFPTAVAANAAGDVFVADAGNNAVKEVLPDGTIKTIGSGFDNPVGVATDAAGDVFVGDTDNNRVVEVSPPSLSVPATPSPLNGTSPIAVSATLTGLAPATTYYYRVVSSSAFGNVAAESGSFTTTAPTFANLTGGSITFEASYVLLSGQLVTTPSTSLPSGLTVLVSINGVTELASVHPDGTFNAIYLFGSALPVAGSPYAITYAYTSPTGSSPAISDDRQSLTVTPATPTLSVTSPVSLTYGSALANGQLAGSATWTVDGSSVSVPGTFTFTTAAGTILNAGIGQTESVTFTPTDSSDYSSATTTVTVNVAQASLTIVPDSEYKTYGTTETFSGTDFIEIGLVTPNGDTITGVTETSTGAPASAAVGTYSIVASGATGTGLSNYIITYDTGILAVTPASLTITANNETKTYGTSVTFSPTAFTETGLLTANGDSITGVTETSTGAPASAAVGTYSIVASSATGTGLSNYIITYDTGILAVAPASLTITANNETKTYGTSVTFSPTAFTETGLVTANGDSITGVTETSTGAPASALPGTYAIVPGAATGNGLSNYTITYLNGALTVNPQQEPAPVVQTIVINGGAVQRSMVTSVTITFNEQVTLSSGAIVVDKQGGGAEGLALNQSVVGGDTVVNVTFTGSDIIGGSLADGNYTLSVNAADVQNSTGQAMVANASDSFWRLFGDARGTGTVDALDYQMFLTAERTQTNVSVFDYYGTGVLNSADLTEFLLRFGKSE